MNCKHGRLPFLCLGLFIGGDSRKLNFLYPLIDCIKRRILRWKSHNHFIGGDENDDLGVRRFKEFNLTLLGKWCWRRRGVYGIGFIVRGVFLAVNLNCFAGGSGGSMSLEITNISLLYSRRGQYQLD